MIIALELLDPDAEKLRGQAQRLGMRPEELATAAVQDKHMWVDCAHCGASVEGEEVGSYEHCEPEEGLPARYSFLRCFRCVWPILALQENYGDGWGEPLQLYPTGLRANPNLPAPIFAAHQKAIACAKARAYTAAAIMCRKTLEGFCAEHGIVERNLVEGLLKMKDAGVIEQRLFEWADALRISGNEAAHDLNVTISADDARDLLEFPMRC